MGVKGVIFADGGEQRQMAFTKEFLVFIILGCKIAPGQTRKSCICSK